MAIPSKRARAGAARPDPLIGTLLGPYRIVEHIGSGGMGSVYRAERADEAFEKEVAIKVVRRGLDLDYVVRHFRLERQIMASLEHPNIARLLDGGATARRRCRTSSWSSSAASPIDAYCEERQPRHRASGWSCSGPICAAVEFAHRLGVVHRDIKPGNILVTATARPSCSISASPRSCTRSSCRTPADTIITVAPGDDAGVRQPGAAARRARSPRPPMSIRWACCCASC